MIKITEIDTPLGPMIAGATEDGICLLEFSDRKSLSVEYETLKKIFDATIKKGNNKHLRMLKKQLKEYFKGKRQEFSLSLKFPGTEFQQAVWTQLLTIPYGSTMTYGEQAEILKDEKSARAVAQANSNNRIAIVIPCHRIIGSDGQLVGYGGGLNRKKWLINHERKYSGKTVELDLF
jgi:AraC family transcriptional regulator of adaptative response/methylated-DNA-[protein]-cysteine methyltransferase